MRIFKTKKALIVLGALVVVAVAAFGAYAYFGNSGTSAVTDSATVTGAPANPLLVTVAPDGAVSPLAPTNIGDANATINKYKVTVANQNEQDEHFSSVTLTVVSTSVGGCTPANFSINGGGPSATVAQGGAGGVTLPPNTDGGSFTTGDYTLQMVETNSPQDACQGAHVNLQAVAN